MAGISRPRIVSEVFSAHPVIEDPPLPSVWIVSDSAVGNLRQAAALAQALRLQAAVLRADLRAPWSWLAPRFLAGAPWAMPAPTRANMRAPWPALAIGCGRAAALVTRWLRRASAGRTFIVQILDPRIEPAQFDLVIAPRHDELSGANVIQTLGSLNPVDDAWLADGLARFPNLAQLPQPRTALLLGGPRRSLAMDSHWFDTFLARVAAFTARDCGSVLITASRRTPADWCARARALLQADCVHFWSGPADGENPYQGYLAAADRFVVSPDSVNMLSEACASGKPVLTLLPAGAHGKIARLHAQLRTQGWLRELDGNVDFSAWSQASPLREMAAVASKVWQAIEAARPGLAASLLVNTQAN